MALRRYALASSPNSPTSGRGMPTPLRLGQGSTYRTVHSPFTTGARGRLRAECGLQLGTN